jgi:phosphomannomutase
MLYFAVWHLDADGGIQITGSHNPPDFNGFKMMMGKKSFYGPTSRSWARSRPGRFRDRQGQGREAAGARTTTPRACCRTSSPAARSRSPGTPATARSACRSARSSTSCRHALHLNEKVDGTFPAHHPDPTVPENLKELQATVKKEGCDLGIAFDGDGDRIGAIDGKGRILWGDQLLILWARDVLKSQPGATIIGDVKASQALFDEIQRAGGTP